MAILATSERRVPRFRILVCAAVATAGLIAGSLSRDETSPEAPTASHRLLAGEERNIIVATIAQTLGDATVATIVWPPLILTSREGISDYCGTVREPNHDVGFYAQLIFPHADPREKLSRVNFAITAVTDNLDARYLVGVACLRYGYGAITRTMP
jgi:hypothetical protein